MTLSFFLYLCVYVLWLCTFFDTLSLYHHQFSHLPSLLFAAVTSLHKTMVSVHFICVFLIYLCGDSTADSSAEVSAELGELSIVMAPMQL